MDIKAIHAFRDNYIWLLTEGEQAVVVDPGDAGPVLECLARDRLKLSAILVTHHHADHIGGINRLLELADVPVYGPAHEDIAVVSVRLAEGDRVTLADLGLELSVLDVPGHTRGHLAYCGPDLLFCGDTLFGGGCGRLFEGSAAQMWRSLQKIAALPATTRAYCAHEYTQSNLAFALAVEPGNLALRSRVARVATARARGEATVPLLLAEELATNPFLRCAEPAVAAAAASRTGRTAGGPEEVFAVIRKWKDGF